MPSVFWALLGIWLAHGLSQGLAYAAPQITGFEARIIKTGPDGTYIEGRLLVQGSELRLDTRTPAGPVVALMDRSSLKLITLNPSARTYSEVQMPEGSGQQFWMIRVNHELPCSNALSSDCVALDDVMVNGRLAKRWLRQGGQAGHQQQWVDAERGWVLRSHAPGSNAFMNLRLVGLETLEGRLVEKWERTQNFGRGPVKVSWFWYDPALELGVREEWLGGYAQAIAHIRPGVQPGWLFRVPAEYQRLSTQGVPDLPTGEFPGNTQVQNHSLQSE